MIFNLHETFMSFVSKDPISIIDIAGRKLNAIIM